MVRENKVISTDSELCIGGHKMLSNKRKIKEKEPLSKLGGPMGHRRENYLENKRGPHRKPKNRQNKGRGHIGKPKKHTWAPMWDLPFCSVLSIAQSTGSISGK